MQQDLCNRTPGRHAWRPAQLHVLIQAGGCEALTTHVFRSDDNDLDINAVFGVRPSLVADRRAQPDGSGPVELGYVLKPAA